MPEYLATRKEGITHFIYKAIPLLSIDVDKETVRNVIKQYILKVSNTYTSYRFNSYSIKLVTLRLYNYNSLEKLIIGRVEKYFIKRLNAAALDTISTPIRIYLVYA